MLYFIAFLLLLNPIAQAADDGEIETSLTQTQKLDTNPANKFHFSLAYIELPTRLEEYTGRHFKIHDNSKDFLSGVALGYERKIMQAGRMRLDVATSVSYFQAENNKDGLGSEELEVELSRYEHEQSFAAASIGLKLSFAFDATGLIWSPFLEAGTGQAQNKLYKKYSFDGLGSYPADYYNVSVEERFTTAQLTLGLELRSYQNFISYFKVSAMQGIATDTEFSKQSHKRIISDENGVTGESSFQDNQNFTAVIYSVGAGYAF